MINIPYRVLVLALTLALLYLCPGVAQDEGRNDIGPTDGSSEPARGGQTETTADIESENTQSDPGISSSESEEAASDPSAGTDPSGPPSGASPDSVIPSGEAAIIDTVWIVDTLVLPVKTDSLLVVAESSRDSLTEILKLLLTITLLLISMTSGTVLIRFIMVSGGVNSLAILLYDWFKWSILANRQQGSVEDKEVPKTDPSQLEIGFQNSQQGGYASPSDLRKLLYLKIGQVRFLLRQMEQGGLHTPQQSNMGDHFISGLDRLAAEEFAGDKSVQLSTTGTNETWPTSLRNVDVDEFDAQREYNEHTNLGTSEQRAFLSRPEHVRVTVPSRNHSASASYKSDEPIFFEKSPDGMFFYVEEKGRHHVFPVFTIKPEQWKILGDCFKVHGRNVDIGRTRERVVKIDKPCVCEPYNVGWVLKERGELTVEQIP